MTDSAFHFLRRRYWEWTTVQLTNLWDLWPKYRTGMSHKGRRRRGVGLPLPGYRLVPPCCQTLIDNRGFSKERTREDRRTWSFDCLEAHLPWRRALKEHTFNSDSFGKGKELRFTRIGIQSAWPRKNPARALPPSLGCIKSKTCQ